MTTMEEVFMKVGEGTEMTLETRYIDGVRVVHRKMYMLFTVK